MAWFLSFQIAVFCAPNIAVQCLLGHADPVYLVLAQFLNAALLVCIFAFFRHTLRMRWPMLALAILSGYSCNFLLHFSSMPTVGAYYSMRNTNPSELAEYLTGKLVLLVLLVVLGWSYLRLYRLLAVPFSTAMPPPRVRKPA